MCEFAEPRDRLEIDIVLEENRDELQETASVLPHVRVFELNHVDFPQVDLPVNQPGKIGVCKFINRVRAQRKNRFARRVETHHQFDRCCCFSKLLICLPFLWVIEQDNEMQFAQRRQTRDCLVHKNAAAVYGRANRIRRNKEHTKRIGPRGKFFEAIAKITTQRTPECLGVGNNRKPSCSRARVERFEKLESCAPQATKIRALRRVSKNSAQDHARRRVAEMRDAARRLMDIFPAEQQAVFLEYRLNLFFRKMLADGTAMLVIDDAARLIEHFPATLPRHKTEIGIFEIKWL